MAAACEHLPECPCHGLDYIDAPPSYKMPSCICDRLRACEQRVLLSKPSIGLSAVYGYKIGRADGLDAARDAVAAVMDNAAPTFAKALAAIDGLLNGGTNGE